MSSVEIKVFGSLQDRFAIDNIKRQRHSWRWKSSVRDLDVSGVNLILGKTYKLRLSTFPIGLLGFIGET